MLLQATSLSKLTQKKKKKFSSEHMVGMDKTYYMMRINYDQLKKSSMK